MWKILEHRDILKLLNRKKIPARIVKAYEAWKRIVELQGPGALRKLPALHDEALAGELTGYRSSRLNLGWRVLYRIEKNEVLVIVERISNHDYRK